MRAQLAARNRSSDATVKLAEDDSGVRVTITSPIDRELSWDVIFNSVRRGN